MKILLFDFNNILTDVEKKLVARGHEVLPVDGKDATWKKADVIVVWQETEEWGKWIKKAQKAGKRVILVQHGRKGISRIYPPFNDPLISDEVCVWGENDVERLVSCGVDRSRIHITGTPIYKYLRPRIEHQGFNVVFPPEHWDRDVAENLIVASALRKIKGINVITKILEREHNPRDYDNPVTSNRLQPGHIEVCAEVLQTADVIVSMSESTFELMAQAMDIPVIIADIWIPKSQAGEERHKLYKREFSKACEKVKDMRKLGAVVHKHLKNPDLLYDERIEVVRGDGGEVEDPTEALIKVILHE